VSWVEISVVFLVSHLVGDFLLQTDWQATHKHAGLGRDRTARRALLSHILTYTLSFVPALIWIGAELGAAEAVGAAALIALPHMVIDDGRLVGAYISAVKHTPSPPPPGVAVPVDQSFHVVSLFGLALLLVA